ncbi:Fur family transcriptional regulator [Thioalkalivibrio sp.]|uniref:Fur family transcriptional regulator n=1 Tax=Thioalkalivibrio sp. TaxID=2093813 RepID=UPI003974EBFF
MSATLHNPKRLTREQAQGLLDRHGIAPTEQRLEIARLLFARHQHLSAEQILAQLSRQASRVSKATVYNTLKLFAETGLVREVIIDSTKRFYDSNPDPHHHLFHTDSGRLEDVAPAQVKISDLPGLSSAVEVLGVDVVIRVGPRRPQ